MYLRPCGLLTITPAALLFLLLPIPVVRGEIEAARPVESGRRR